ncbi:MAG: tRNA 4-thiouridine(8) synthase ThiI [Anaerolineae bacterium]|nr:tRNA 4-thiouridine(8) synthase ThiI [Anaerolineae bacterium]
MKTYIVHYSELALKGRNRRKFEWQLIENMRTALTPWPGTTVKRFHSYIVVEIPEDVPTEIIEARLAQVFGIAYIAPALRVPTEIGAIGEAARALAQEIITKETTFRLDVRRSYKEFPGKSMEIARDIGALVVQDLGAPVKMKNPDVTITIQIYRESAYLFARRIPCAEGLPIGSSGHVLTLLSGGIDSPVAAHLLLKRGCTTDFLHFHILPNSKQVHQSKVIEMARTVMAPHRIPTNIYMAPAYPFQMALLEIDSPVEVVAFRRFIMSVAVRIAKKNRALALITGDNLGQVASQTLQNIAVTSQAVDMPILRPLIAFNKSEIIDLAQEIGTYTLSIQPYKDPCSLHADNPATWARLAEVQELEAKIDMEAVIEETIENTEKISVSWDSD